MAGVAVGKLTGLDALQRGLGRLAQRVSREIAHKAVTAAIQPVVRDARVLARQRTGMLRRAIGYVVRYYDRSQITVGVVGVREDFRGTHGGKEIAPGRYANLEERGRRSVHVIRKRVLSDGTTIFGRSVGSAEGSHFMERAWHKNRLAVERIMAGVIADELTKSRA